MGVRRVLAGLLLAAPLLAAGGGALAWPELVPERGAVPGLRIAGVALEPGTDVRTHVQSRAHDLAAHALELRLEDGTSLGRRSLAELGVRVDVETVSRRASALGRRGSWGVRAHELWRARQRGVDVPLALSVDVAQLASVLAPWKAELDRLPRPARFELPAGDIVPDEPGVFLDVDATAERLLAAARRADPSLEVASRQLRDEVNSELLAELDRGTVLARFSTHFSRWGDAADRAVNIETAASRLNGLVLAPGALVSFNRFVGARTLENGFRPGWEIYKGEMVRGVGGGTCQVSSTLHAAALYAGLEIVERYPHSRPSAYIPMGLDSTVSWPSVDLKLRNPWSFPVVVQARVDGTELEVQLLGASKPAEVQFSSDTLDIIPFDRKVTESGWLAEGKVIKKQRGIRGFRVRRTRSLTLQTGEVRTEVSEDVYPPTDEHYIVPRGADVDEALPPPPPGSKAAERALATEPGGSEQATLDSDRAAG